MLTPLVHANGAAIPAIGLGTWPMKGEEAARAVARALEAGYRAVDTAAMYANEDAVGEGLRAAGVPRADVFVTTKVWYTDLAPGALQRSAEASLRRLGLDQVDLLLIHWPSTDIPLEGSIAALCDAKRRGLARHVGVSNFPVALLDSAVSLATEPLVANQCEYHPHLDQTKLLAACRRHGLAFLSYAPIGRARSWRTRRSAASPPATAGRRRRSCCAGTCSRTASRRSRNQPTRSASTRTSTCSGSRCPMRRCAPSRASRERTVAWSRPGGRQAGIAEAWRSL